MAERSLQHRCARPRLGPARSQLLCWSSGVAAEPSPSSATVSGAGCRVSKGCSGWAVVTPEPSGYSKLWLWARISCPWLADQEGDEPLGGGLLPARGEDAGAGHVDDVARVPGGEGGDGRMHVGRPHLGPLAVPVVMVDDRRSRRAPVDLVDQRLVVREEVAPGVGLDARQPGGRRRRAVGRCDGDHEGVEVGLPLGRVRSCPSTSGWARSMIDFGQLRLGSAWPVL